MNKEIVTYFDAEKRQIHTRCLVDEEGKTVYRAEYWETERCKKKNSLLKEEYLTEDGMWKRACYNQNGKKYREYLYPKDGRWIMKDYSIETGQLTRIFTTFPGGKVVQFDYIGRKGNVINTEVKRAEERSDMPQNNPKFASYFWMQHVRE